ncbi:MAG: hypothetical protein K0R97_3212, partial [Oerskovia sp.]|nr:hypothetical protein [Oerskovia sp.]
MTWEALTEGARATQWDRSQRDVISR